MRALGRAISRVIPSPECLWLLVFFYFCLRPPLDGDTFLHIATGRLVTQGTIPTVDSFSHTVAGKEWIAHEWLAGLGLYRIYTHWGLGAIVWGTALLATVTLWLIGRLYSLAGVTSPLARGVAIFATAMCTVIMVFPRPHLITFFFLVLTLLILRRDAAGADRRWLLVLPPVFTIWANCHAGVILGVIPFVEALVDSTVAWTEGDSESGRRLQALLLTAAVCVGAVAVNPFGPRLLLLPLTLNPGARFLRPVIEWTPPTWQHAWPSVLVILAVVGTYIRHPVGTAGRFLSLLIAVYLALQAIRNLFLIGIFGTPFLAESLQMARNSDDDPDEWGMYWSNGIRSFAAVSFVALVSLPWALHHDFLDRVRFPSAAATWLKAHHPPGRLYNNYNTGGYLIMALDGSYPVFMDGRIDVYQRAGRLQDYFIVDRLLPGWSTVLEKNGVNIVLDRPASRLVRALWNDPQWRVAFRQDDYVVMLRTRPLPSPHMTVARGPL